MSILVKQLHSLVSIYVSIQERIRIGKELLEAKRIEEENERKRSGLTSIFIVLHPVFCFECA